ncbi:MAG TPA: zf-HC2 domain-containing protein [Anaeromyxobacter sp.]
MIPVALDVPGCEEVARKLSDFLDGELEPPAAARLVLHLAACPGCARLAIELDATIRALHQLPRGFAVPTRMLH